MQTRAAMSQCVYNAWLNDRGKQGCRDSCFSAVARLAAARGCSCMRDQSLRRKATQQRMFAFVQCRALVGQGDDSLLVSSVEPMETCKLCVAISWLIAVWLCTEGVAFEVGEL